MVTIKNTSNYNLKFKSTDLKNPTPFRHPKFVFLLLRLR